MPEPITLDQAKAHLRKTTDDENAWITDAIIAAREWVANYTAFDFATAPTPDDVPLALRQAMLLLIGHWYQSRGAVAVGTIAAELPLGVVSLCRPFRGGVLA